MSYPTGTAALEQFSETLVLKAFNHFLYCIIICYSVNIFITVALLKVKRYLFIDGYAQRAAMGRGAFSRPYEQMVIVYVHRLIPSERYIIIGVYWLRDRPLG